MYHIITNHVTPPSFHHCFLRENEYRVCSLLCYYYALCTIPMPTCQGGLTSGPGLHVIQVPSSRHTATDTQMGKLLKAFLART